MCLTAEATVLAVEGDAAVVEIDGRTRRAPALLVPDLRPGDRVLIGLGHVLSRIDPTAEPPPTAVAAPLPTPPQLEGDAR